MPGKRQVDDRHVVGRAARRRLGEQLERLLRASRPTRLLIPQLLIWRVQDARGWSRVDSTTQRAHAGQQADRAPRRPALRRPASRSVPVNQKVEPTPSADSTWIVPPIISTSCLLMARPRPVPPCLRVVEPSACENFSKMRACASSLMPRPVSRHLEAHASRARASSSARGRRAITTEPCSVNLIALPTRLVSTWPSRSGSPFTCGGEVRRDAAGELQALAVRALGEQLDDVLDRPAQVQVDVARARACRLRSWRSRACR